MSICVDLVNLQVQTAFYVTPLKRMNCSTSTSTFSSIVITDPVTAFFDPVLAVTLLANNQRLL